MTMTTTNLTPTGLTRAHGRPPAIREVDAEGVRQFEVNVSGAPLERRTALAFRFNNSGSLYPVGAARKIRGTEPYNYAKSVLQRAVARGDIAPE
jgi:hypothetical protein